MRDALIDCIVKNNDARVEMSEEATYEPTGNGTEVAMLRFLQSNEISVQDLLTQRQREAEHECSIPFNPERKRQTTVYRPFKGADYVRIVVKGAPEVVLPLCNFYLDSMGSINHLDERKNMDVLNRQILENYAKSGLRTLVYAYKDMNSDEWENLQVENRNFILEEDRYIVEEGLTFVAGFGILDPPRVNLSVCFSHLR